MRALTAVATRACCDSKSAIAVCAAICARSACEAAALLFGWFAAACAAR